MEWYLTVRNSLNDTDRVEYPQKHVQFHGRVLWKTVAEWRYFSWGAERK